MSHTLVLRESFPSKSEPGEKHWVSVYDDDTISCSCRGFSTPSKCWHVRKVAKNLGRVLDLSTWGASLGPPVQEDLLQ